MRPALLVSSRSAPYSSTSTCTVCRSACAEAWRSAVLPEVDRAWMVSPLLVFGSSSHLIISLCPAYAANRRGVLPLELRSVN